MIAMVVPINRNPHPESFRDAGFCAPCVFRYSRSCRELDSGFL